MKKSLLLLGLLGTTICLTACGSKNFDMSFDEALEIANHSEFQEILSQNDNFEQSFDIAGNFNYEGSEVNATITSNSKQNLTAKNSETSSQFDANISSEGNNIKINGALGLKQIEDIIYINIPSLDVSGLEALGINNDVINAYTNQRFSISTNGVNNIPDTFSTLRDAQDLNEKSKEIIINEGSTVYNGKFTQFNGYNARKISLDNEKLNELVKEYYDSMNKNLDEEYREDAPELNIQNFEGYLVITGKDKVTTVIENMEILQEDFITSANGFAGEDFELYLTANEENLISIVAQKKGGKYNISVNISDITLEGTISPRLSKSSINLKYDLTLRVKSQEEGKDDMVIPFKGTWKYNSISEFTTTAPEDAQDLNELLGGYTNAMYGNEYDYDEEYNSDLYNDEYIDTIENLEDATPSEEIEDEVIE